MLNWQTENPKNYNNKNELTVKKHAKNLFNSFWLRRYANIPKNILVYLFQFVFLVFVRFVRVVRLRSIFYAFSSIWFQIDAIQKFIEIPIIHSIGLEFCLSKILGSFSFSRSHTHTLTPEIIVWIFAYLNFYLFMNAFVSLLFLLLFLMMLR